MFEPILGIVIFCLGIYILAKMGKWYQKTRPRLRLNADPSLFDITEPESTNHRRRSTVPVSSVSSPRTELGFTSVNQQDANMSGAKTGLAPQPREEIARTKNGGRTSLHIHSNEDDAGGGDRPLGL